MICAIFYICVTLRLTYKQTFIQGLRSPLKIYSCLFSVLKIIISVSIDRKGDSFAGFDHLTVRFYLAGLQVRLQE